MSAKNVETLRAAHQAFNKRDFDAVVQQLSKDAVYRDHGREAVFNGPKEFKGNLHGWVEAFSDAKVIDASYIDAGDTVIAQFTGMGTNDGPIGALPATGRPVRFAECEVVRFGPNGQIIGCDAYYDQLSIMVQLGHAEAPAETAGR